MLITRLAKIVMCLVLGLFCLVVTFDNITDYTTNYVFVQHVLDMDTTFPGNELMYRSINDPLIWKISYAAIIAAEGMTGHSVPRRRVHMSAGCGRQPSIFNRAKTFAIAGALVAFLVWFFGFMVVAGEWFAMWQSSKWNGQDAAFRFYMAVLGVLIFLNQPDPDLPAGEREKS